MQELHFQTVPIPAGVLIVAETGSNFDIEFPETAAASNHVSEEEILKLTPNLPYGASPFLLLLKKTSNALQIR